MEQSDESRQEMERILDRCVSEAFQDFDAQTNLKELYLDSLIKETFFKHLKAGYRDWSAARRCFYPGCTAKTDISSHTIQRAGSLRFISETGHVMIPQMNFAKAKMEFQEIGIGEASTFVGFCERHENIFDFERVGSIEEEHDICSQVFRTVCSELRQLEHQIIWFREAQLLYQRRTRAELILRVMNKLGDEFFKKYQISKVGWRVNVENGITELSAKTIVDLVKNYIRNMLFYKSFREGADGRLMAQGLQTFILRLPCELPLALSGRTGFTALENNTEIDVDLFFNVLPFPKETLFFATTTESRRPLLERFLSMYPSDLQRLSLIESRTIQ